MKVGFIGLGHMGAGMAASLLRAGHELTVYNRTPSKAARMAARGARVGANAADACRGDAVITMLANDRAIEDVVLGDGGVLASLPSGAIHVSSSTISVELVERMTAAHAARGVRFISAPVFGRPDVAAAGQLMVVAAGPADAIEAAAPLLDAFGRQTSIVSETPSDANLVKLSGNFLIASVIESLGEAIALVAKAGMDPRRYVEVMTSSLFDLPIHKTYAGLIAERRFEPPLFAAPLAQKDIRLAMAAADGLGVPMPFGGVLRDRFATLMAHGGERLDWSAIGRLAADDAAETQTAARA